MNEKGQPSAHLQRYLPLLRFICKHKAPMRRRALDDYADDPHLYSSLREIMKALQKKRIPLTKKDKKKLMKEGKTISSILKKGNDVKTKRKLVMQTGSGFILPILIPLVAEVVREIIQSRSNK